MTMKNLKQTTLSFASAQKRVEVSPKNTQDATPAASSSKTTKSQKGKKTSSQRHTKMNVYVEIPPATRGPRATASARGSSAKSTSTRMSTYGLPRKASAKRKLSPESEVDETRDGLPRITVDPASSQQLPTESDYGKSCDTSKHLLWRANITAEHQEKPSKKLRLSSSSPLSALTPLPPSDAPSSVHSTDMDDVEFVPTSQSDEMELTLPRLEEKDPSDMQETVNRWRKETQPEPPSRADSPFSSDRFGSPLSDIPMDVDYDMFPQPLTIPDTPVAESRTSVPYPHTPVSANGEGPEALSTIPATTSNAAWATPKSRIETPSQHRDAAREASIPGVPPLDIFRSLTPPPSSSDAEEEAAVQEDVPVIEALDVKSKTAQLIADIKARAFAAARSSPEQPRKELDDLSDSDSESSSDDSDGPGLVAQLMQDAKGKAKA